MAVNKNELEIVIREQREELEMEQDFVPRQLEESFLRSKKIVAISGVRRSGKSTLLRQISQTVDGFYYLNFEDERLLKFDYGDFNTLLELFQTIYGEQKIVLFDEIQEVVGWEKFVSRLFRSGYKVFVTGSNANLLSSELATCLTGRHLVKKMYPFSFAEFLRFNKFPIKSAYVTKEKAKLMAHFRQFIEMGGFPEMVRDKNVKEFDQLYQDILIKDLLVRFRIKEQKSFRELALFYLSNVGTRISYNNLKKMLGFASVSTVKTYSEYLENSYLNFFLSKFDYSLRKQIINDKKVYGIDTGLINNIAFKISPNHGRLLENVVFLELLRREAQVYYFSENNKECDFVIRQGDKITEAMQVVYDLNARNEKREIGGLLEATKKFDLQSGLILTGDREDEFEVSGKKIKIIPVWKWLLERRF